MKLIGNILWLLLGGVELAIGYALAGLISFALIFTIPFGVASFRLAGYALWPFGRVLVRKPGAGVGSGLANLVWMLIAGVWLALGHLLAALINAITIIGGEANRVKPAVTLPITGGLIKTARADRTIGTTAPAAPRRPPPTSPTGRPAHPVETA